MPTPTDPLPSAVVVRIEVSAGGRVKRDPSGAIALVSPWPSPFNYGSVPGTLAADGDPLDALVLGPALPRDDERRWPVHGVVRFVDRGEPDAKLVCGADPPSAAEIAKIELFFRTYARLKSAAARLRGHPPARSHGYHPR